MGSMFGLGAVLEGRFQLISTLGEGAMGAVWLARDNKLGIDVAMKVMRAGMTLDPARRAAFEREAELCARMLSPHIVRVLSYGILSNNDVPYIVYEALEGEPLDRRIHERKRLGLDETEEIIVHVARALARAHSMGVVHKDIKPANVYITKDDRGRTLAKVLDFGIAEIVQAHPTEVGIIAGTPEYMPLEVFRGAPPDARADLFALAVLAYECLSGAVPYEGESVMDMIDSLSGAPPSLTRTFSEEAAYPLDAWMRRGLAPDAGLRFQSARDLAESLHEAIKQAKGALGLIPPASARKLGAERVVPENNVDKVTQSPRSAGAKQTLQPSTPRPPPLPVQRLPPPRQAAQAAQPAKQTHQPAKQTYQPAKQTYQPAKQTYEQAKQTLPSGKQPPNLAAAAANLPPMRPRAESFVFDEDMVPPARDQRRE